MTEALTARVSAALRNAGLPVLRYGNRSRGRSGVRVSNSGGGTCDVFVHVYLDDDIAHSATDPEAEQDLSDKARAVLLARGFDVDRDGGGPNLTVRSRSRESAPEEDTAAVVAASGLDITQPARNEWHVEVDGRRGAYSIHRTGNGDRTRFAVSGRGYGNELARNLRSMGAAIDAVKQDMDLKGMADDY